MQETGVFTKWFRRSFHRMGCLNLLGLAALLAVWSISHIMPILRVEKELFLNYGKVHAMSRSGRLGQFFFRINGDDNVNFWAWSGAKQRQDLQNWFRNGSPLEIWSMRSSKEEFLVLSVSSEKGEVGAAHLIRRYKIIVGGSLAVFLFSFSIVLWLSWQYLVWFRHGPWFSVRSLQRANTP